MLFGVILKDTTYIIEEYADCWLLYSDPVNQHWYTVPSQMQLWFTISQLVLF